MAIEDLVARGGGERGPGGGQTVVTRDQDDPDAAPMKARVTRTYQRTALKLQSLTLRDPEGREQTLRVTTEHPFYVNYLGWTPARYLEAGDQIRGLGEPSLTVVRNLTEDHPEGVTVYNMEVDGAHSYFVLAADAPPDTEAAWVHNAGYIDEAIANQDALVKSGAREGQVRHIDPTTNRTTISPRSMLDGDHVLPKQAFKDAVSLRETTIGRALNNTEKRQVITLMNSAENLRPMINSFNRSKSDLLAGAWKALGTDLTKSVHPGYIKSMAKTQSAVNKKLTSLLGTFKPM
jgi:hypothetical protein